MSSTGEVNDKPQRLFYFLMALSELSRQYRVIVANGDLEFVENPGGRYCLNPNNEGPEFGWLEDPKL